MALNPYEFWRAQKSRVAICANPMPTRCTIFSLIEATFTFTAYHHYQEGRGSTRWEGSAHPNPPGGGSCQYDFDSDESLDLDL